MQSFEAWQKFNAIAGTLGQDPTRFAALQKAEARYWGLAYEARPYPWGAERTDDTNRKSAVVRADQKRPLRQYNLARLATDETVDLLCGEGRFPTLTVVDDPAATEALPVLAKHCQLEAFVRELATRVVSVGAAALTLRLDAIPASWATLDVWSARYCLPTFGEDDPAEAMRLGVAPRGLLSLRIQYAYSVTTPGKSDPDWFIFRRDYTAEEVIDYQPWPMPSGQVTEPPRFTEAARVPHGLGRVPAVWVRSRYVEGEVDGPGLYEAVDSLLTGIDEALSSLDSSVRYSVSPTLAIEGVRAESLGTAELGGGHGNTLCFPPQPGGQNPTARYLEIQGTSHESARKHIAELRDMAIEVMRVVIRRPSDAAGALSGTALEILFRPMISLVSGYRTAMEGAIADLAELLLLTGDRYGSTLRTKTPLPAYTPGPVQVDWPPVFAPTTEDIAQLAQALASLVMAGLLSRETAIERVAAILRLDDVGDEKARIQADRDAAAAQATAAFDAALASQPGQSGQPSDAGAGAATDVGGAPPQG